MRRRDLLAASAGLATAGVVGRTRAATPATTIRFVPQADLSSIDPVWTTATVAFTHGMDAALVVAAVIALAGGVLAMLYLPARPDRPTEVAPLTPVSPLPAAESVL